MSKRAPASAYDRALRFLSIRDHSEAELRRKLRRGQQAVEPEEIDRAIERVRSLGYLDDAKFARARARSLVANGHQGPRAVALKLRQAGVDAATVRGAVQQAMEGQDELALARALLEKRHPQAIGSGDPKLKAKAMRFLIGRGFSPGVVYRLLRVDEE